MSIQLEKFLMNDLEPITGRIFAYVNRAALAGLTLQASVIVDSFYLKGFSYFLFSLLLLNLSMDVNHVSDALAARIRGFNRALIRWVVILSAVALVTILWHIGSAILSDLREYFSLLTIKGSSSQ
ncbi:hypothetical protein KZO85_12710 [Chromohalobacter canadensis]|uniref:hypothetical protein n=1 Tax=Chromohalobacter canadensis TaxID=141389 RepID=UPI0021C1DCD0|nr:hypothetical protein [Chromohalobacter canadensis]MCT8469447.1 hypothetical protein [Chromohalobacter canadensis]MCT8472071.1 hypothetical protein [Chromohalobacter canadensis]MCT8499816.1 hypothetical protein [Chromohalobacter canadensis]